MVPKLLARVRETIHQHQMLVSSDRVLAGVSGGADSVCLTLLLKELGYDVAIAHVNHGLRGIASDGDAAFVGELAQQLGLKFFERRIDLCGGNIEAAGRDARKEFFREVAHEHGFTKIAVAHTRQDRIETFLLNLLRGAGSAGLASMTPVSGALIRPLIETSRNEIEEYLQIQHQTWRTDATNFQLDFARNRLRHVVIPGLVADFNPNLLETLGRTMEILEAEEAWMGSLSDNWLASHGTTQGNDFVLEVTALRAAPVALTRRVLRDGLRWVRGEMHDITFDQIEGIRELLEDGKSGKYVQIPGGIQAAREFDRLVFRQKLAAVSDYAYELQIPGAVRVPEAGRVFRAEIIEFEAPETPGQRVFVDADSIGAYVRIRNWKPGDYYKPVGMPAGKLKKLFQRARIPRSHRASWPVVVADSTIIWVASFPVSREFAPRGRSQKIVAIEALQI